MSNELMDIIFLMSLKCKSVKIVGTQNKQVELLHLEASKFK